MPGGRFRPSSLKGTVKSGKPRQVLSECLWISCAGRWQSGQDKEARLVDDERKALWKEQPVADLVELARMQAVRAT